MSKPDLTRREFGKRTITTTALGSLAAMGTAGISSETVSARAEEVLPAIAEPIPPASIPVELLLLEVIRQSYPDRHLTHQILSDIRRDIQQELRRAKAIRAVPLTNVDEPASQFAAYRGQD